MSDINEPRDLFVPEREGQAVSNRKLTRHAHAWNNRRGINPAHQVSTISPSGPSNGDYATADVVATSNVALSGVTTISGYTLQDGDIVLLTAQTSGAQNGVYGYQAAGGLLLSEDPLQPDFVSVDDAMGEQGPQSNTLWLLDYNLNEYNRFRPPQTVSIVIDGGGSTITTSSPLMGGATVLIPQDYLINAWTVEADQSGSIVVDVQRANAGVPSSSIVGAGNSPTLSSAQFAGPTTVSGWTSTQLHQNDILGFQVMSCTGCQRATVSLLLR